MSILKVGPIPVWHNAKSNDKESNMSQWITTSVQIAGQVCPLCENRSNPLESYEFHKCDSCCGIFRSRKYHLPPDREKDRYLDHNNDVYDDRYRQFVFQITNDILQTYNLETCGLDYGAGPGPVISKVLHEQGYHIAQYDPFFSPDPSLFAATYDFIVRCEVIEHFFNPSKELALLKRLLKPGGRLYCMTHLYEESTSSDNWHYKRDPSHVIFYRAETLMWVAQAHRHSNVTIRNRLAVFQN